MNRISDYALIGDCHSAALVGRDGSIDWACFPRFDSRSVFCKILDEDRGGSFLLAPRDVREVTRAYIEDTNVLATGFTARDGALEVTDCMPVEPLDAESPTEVASYRGILRRARCTEGQVEVLVDLAPRFDYGSCHPRFRSTSRGTGEIFGGADALSVVATHPLEARSDRMVGSWRLKAGEEAWIRTSWARSYDPGPDGATDDTDRISAALGRQLDDTIRFWKTWSERCWYRGEWEGPVRRSALVLKALTYAPSGAVVAAPTTSLPEEIGGVRNWDYRYTWIRDATLTLISLFILGFTDEAGAFKRWLERIGGGRPEELQIMYGVGGERFLPELELSHLSGHRGSMPVRIGNAAAKQLQLDSYGQILEAAYLFARAGGTYSDANWIFLAGLADIVCRQWRQPDQGIWELRDDPRHFLHSKLNCWVALDRAVRIATMQGLPARVERWTKERDAVHTYLLDVGRDTGWFPQAEGFDVADASTLLFPASGLIDTSDPLVGATVEKVRAFLLCSFWLLDCLTHAGRLDEAEALLERLLGLANDVGLYAEEVDPATGEALGNFPQAFSHMALVLSCAHLSAAKRGEIPKGRQDYAELALDRLIAKLGSDRTPG